MTRKQHPYYPIYLDVEGHDVLVVGGGEVATRKAETLLRSGARVTIVAPEPTQEVEALVTAGRLLLERRRYEERDLEGRLLAVAATNDLCANARVARDCRRRRVAVNVVDAPHLSTFIVPSTVERGSIQIAISTGGRSPALARTLRRAVEETIGEEYAELNDLLGLLRASAKESLPTATDRRRFFRDLVDEELGEGLLTLLRSGRRAAAYERLAALCGEAGVPLPAAVHDRLHHGPLA